MTDKTQTFWLFYSCVARFGSGSVTCVTISQSLWPSVAHLILISSLVPYTVSCQLNSSTFSNSPQPIMPTPAHPQSLQRTSPIYNPTGPIIRSKIIYNLVPSLPLSSPGLSSVCHMLCNVLLQLKYSSLWLSPQLPHTDPTTCPEGSAGTECIHLCIPKSQHDSWCIRCIQ